MRMIFFCLVTLMAVAEPRVPYEKRMALAREAPSDLSLLGRTVAAMSLLRREENLHQWGLLPAPLDSRPRLPVPHLSDKTRSILGHSWKCPERPVALDEKQAPWPWQVEQALKVYLGRMAPHDPASAEVWLQACLKLPQRSDDECLAFVESCQSSSHWKNRAVLKRWREIALNRKFPQAGMRVASSFTDACRLWNAPESMTLGQEFTLEMLRKAPSENLRQQVAYGMKNLRENWDRNLGKGVRQPEPTACILESLKLSQDARRGDAWTRLYTYGFSACEAMDNPPIPVDRRMDPQSPLVARRLRELGIWLAAR